jgi:extradiol dioxygenase
MDIRGLGYVGLKSPEPENWRKWGKEIMGFGDVDPMPEVAAVRASGGRDPEAVYLRLDDRRLRLAIYPGDREGELAFVGWELADRLAFRDALEHLKALGMAYEVASEALAFERGVQGMAFFHDPAGYRHEIFYSAYYMEDSFLAGRPLKKGFRTEHGMGHIVLMVPELTDELDAFGHTVLGMRVYAGGVSIPNSGAAPGDDGRVRTEMYRGRKNKLSHNLVYMEKKGYYGLHHMFIEYQDLDDMGRTYDLVQRKSEYPLVMTLGRHQADTFLSFYAQTPSKFLFEVSWNSMEVDDETFVQTRPLHSFVWGLDQIGPVILDHLRIDADPPNYPPRKASLKAV